MKKNHSIVTLVVLPVTYLLPFRVLKPDTQGFMPDRNIASHTCLGEHMDVNC